MWNWEEAENTEKLEAFIAAVNNNDNSHLVTVPPGPHILSDILISSPVITGEEGGAPGAIGGGGGDFGAYGGVDPNLEPELALALKVSMEEERARQEAARKAEGSQTETPSQPTTAAQTPSTEVQMGEAEMDDEDLLQQAIAMSMQAEKATATGAGATAGVGATPTVPATTQDIQMEDDEDLRLAMQMSMQGGAQPATQQKPEGDLNAAMNDPSFVNSLLASLPGVDPDDERIKNALKQLEKKDK